MNTLKRISKLSINSPAGNRKFGLDITFRDDSSTKPVIVFVHGFKGFKDWGPFPLMADYFAHMGYIFVKFNFSHNGTTLEKPLDFADLEAFGNNRYSIELDEIGYVLDFIDSPAFPIPEDQLSGKQFLIGHSRGGGISIAKCNEEPRIHSLATLAAVGNLAPWDEKAVETWKKDGVIYIHNGRTHQDMPLYFSLVEDYLHHENRLNLADIAPRLSIPWLIIHGDADETVPIAQGLKLHELNPKSQWLQMEGAGHTFDGNHPFDGDQLPGDLLQALKAIHEHFQKSL